MKPVFNLVASTIALALCSTGLAGQSAEGERIATAMGTQYETVDLVRVVGGLEHPWSMAFLPDGRMLVTERPGRLNVIDDGDATEISELPWVHVQGQGGLLEVTPHPDYEENGWIYLTYTKGDDQGSGTALGRGRLDGSSLTDFEELFVMNAQSTSGRHYAGRLAFMPDGTLLLSIGDRGDLSDQAQDLTKHTGSIIRLNDDGTVPADNPYTGNLKAMPEIYSWGHRNPQGLAVHPVDGTVWQTEHGPRGGDELNIIASGNNYGWPIVSQGRDYGTEEQFGMGRQLAGIEPPVHAWSATVAPSGLAIYKGDAFPNWQGNLFAGSLAGSHVRRLLVAGHEILHEEVLLQDEIGRIRDVRVGPDGHIYIATDEPDGGIYRLEPTAEEADE